MASCGTITVTRDDTGTDPGGPSPGDPGNGDPSPGDPSPGDPSPGNGRNELPFIGELSLDNPRAVGAGVALGVGVLYLSGE
jgi:hypothetical protein